MVLDELRTSIGAARLVVTLMVAFGVIGGGGFGFGMLVGSSAVVDPGEKAIKVSGGEFQGVVDSGIHPGVPMYDRYRIFDMRHNLIEKSGENSVHAVTEDDINVEIEATIRWDIRDGQDLADIYNNVAKSQDNLEAKIVEPAIEDALQICATQRTATEVVSSQREEYKQCVREKLQEQLRDEGLTVYSVSITNMNYPKSVQQKFEAEKNAELQKQIAEKEGEAQVIRAEKRAESIRTVRSELTGQYIQYYAVEEGLSKANTIYVVPSDGGVAPEMAIEPGPRSGTAEGSYTTSPSVIEDDTSDSSEPVINESDG